jgi:hypothetical protein
MSRQTPPKPAPPGAAEPPSNITELQNTSRHPAARREPNQPQRRAFVADRNAEARQRAARNAGLDAAADQRLAQEDRHGQSIRRAVRLDTIRAAAVNAHTAETRLYEAVAEARAERDQWAEIGKALGVTASSAQERFSKPPRGRLFLPR